MLLGTILAYTLFTGATACAPTAQVFVLLQFCARTFAVAETLLAVVVIAEEFDPDVRGWGLAPWERSRPAAPGSRPSCLWGSRLALGLAQPLSRRARSPAPAGGLEADPARNGPLCCPPGHAGPGHLDTAPAGRARAAVPRPSWGRRGGGIHPRTGRPRPRASSGRNISRTCMGGPRRPLACSPSPEVPWRLWGTRRWLGE